MKKIVATLLFCFPTGLLAIPPHESQKLSDGIVKRDIELVKEVLDAHPKQDFSQFEQDLLWELANDSFVQAGKKVQPYLSGIDILTIFLSNRMIAKIEPYLEVRNFWIRSSARVAEFIGICFIISGILGKYASRQHFKAKIIKDALQEKFGLREASTRK